jgi:coatomer protein complex subunit gamma
LTAESRFPSGGLRQVQFHALALLYELKKGDRLALHKVVPSMARNSLKSPMAECLLVSPLDHLDGLDG